MAHRKHQIGTSHVDRIDGLTGLASRGRLERCLERRCRRSGSSTPAGGTVILLDIVGLKGVNQARGFLAGDELIFEVVRRMVRLAGNLGRNEVVLGRLGGDEFLAIFRPRHAALAEAFAAAISRPSGRPPVRVAVTTIHPDDSPRRIIERLDSTLRAVRTRAGFAERPGGSEGHADAETASTLDESGRKSE